MKKNTYINKPAAVKCRKLVLECKLEAIVLCSFACFNSLFVDALKLLRCS